VNEKNKIFIIVHKPVILALFAETNRILMQKKKLPRQGGNSFLCLMLINVDNCSPNPRTVVDSMAMAGVEFHRQYRMQQHLNQAP